MDSTIFNRRTLLGGGALVGLGALLAACGQQGTAIKDGRIHRRYAPIVGDGVIYVHVGPLFTGLIDCRKKTAP